MTHGSASDRFLTIVKNRAQGQDISFSQAWNASALELPDLYAKSVGRIFNRGEVTSTAAFKRAEDRAADALKRLEEAIDNPPHADRGTFMANDNNLRGTFKSEIKRLREKGMSIAGAFEEIKATEPVFWQRYVLKN